MQFDSESFNIIPFEKSKFHIQQYPPEVPGDPTSAIINHVERL